MSRNAFLTGGTGFVGTHIARALLDEGWAVNALVRDPNDANARRLAGWGARIHRGDVTDPASLRTAMSPVVDAVFHVAADTSVWARNDERQARVNIGGTRNVLEAAESAGVSRLVHTSSFSTWGFVAGVLSESSPRSQRGTWINYIRTKRAAEDLVIEATEAGRLQAVICNPAHILGPGDRHNWSRIIRMVAEDRLPGVPPGGGAFADVRAVARAHLAACETGRSGQRYLLGGDDVAFMDLVRAIGDRLGRRVPRRATPPFVLKALGHFNVARAAFTGSAPDLTPQSAVMISHHAACDSTLAQETLGYRTTPIDVLLDDTMDWMRKEGLLT